MAAHLQEATIVKAIFAKEDRLHRRLHVVIDAALTAALEQGESPVVGIEHHLLRLARIGAHEHHPAVAQPHMRDLHGHRHPTEQHDLVAPIELIGFTWPQAQWDVGRGGSSTALLGPSLGVTTTRVVAALVTAAAELVEWPDQRQPFTSGLGGIACQQFGEVYCPWPQLRSRLD